MENEKIDPAVQAVIDAKKAEILVEVAKEKGWFSWSFWLTNLGQIALAVLLWSSWLREGPGWAKNLTESVTIIFVWVVNPTLLLLATATILGFMVAEPENCKLSYFRVLLPDTIGSRLRSILGNLSDVLLLVAFCALGWVWTACAFMAGCIASKVVVFVGKTVLSSLLDELAIWRARGREVRPE